MKHLGNKPLAPVSVVIPAFRAKETLAAAIESVARQTVLPLEVIVVDDGSGDGTAEFVSMLATQYEAGWLRLLVLERNMGAASARNAGWAAARGEYVAFLDADDTWLPQKIELQYDYLRHHPEVAVCGHRFRFTGDRPMQTATDQTLQVEVIRPLRMLLFNPFVTPSVMVRADLPLRFYAGKRYVDDHLLWMEAVLDGFRVVRLSAQLAVIGKALFGESGLSADLWKMERGELHNYQLLCESGRIGWLMALSLMGFSLVKFLRRLLIVAARRIVR